MRIEDKRVLSLVRAFLKAGILAESGALQDTSKGTPQGGILSPLLANMALTVLDEHFAEQRSECIELARRRRHGLANVRLIRYADDFLIMVSGTRRTLKRCLMRWPECCPDSGFGSHRTTRE
ncbi:reverse transcriptase domain-containing protein [Streptomyces syringium]|uniref:reverse transcriptase domain-containing protein n=1 Tax=Streptomyces syringium TaxID=76729 RepID=UPI003456AA63